MSKPWLQVLKQIGAAGVGEIVGNSPDVVAAINEARGDATEVSRLEWLPILVELGEEIVARIIDKSPDTASAIEAAHENFTKAEEEAQALKNEE